MSSSAPPPSPFGKLYHVGVAVDDLERALSFWTDVAGLELLRRETHEGYDVEVAFLSCGNTRIELIRGLRPESVISRFVEKRGPGIHHLTFWVDDLEATLARLERAGVPLIDREPRGGAGGHRVAFLHPKAAGGVLVELAEKQDQAP
jgi:methylmalonyl-CoA epimerase